MLFEDYSEKVSSYGFIAGLVIGQIGGIVIALLTELDIVSGLTNGGGAGIIIGMIPAYMLINEKLSDTKMVIPFAMGWGTFVGIVVGLAAAWARQLSYTCGFSYGAVAGLVSGVVLGLILWTVPEDTEDGDIGEEELVEITE